MNYLKNTWYAAAWNSEVEPAKLFTRTLLDEPILFFRDSKNQLNALHNRCPHRFAPLSAGKHLGDSVQCAYHGLEFGGDGNCTKNPHGDGKIPRGACVKRYPVVERYSLVWIWMGEPEKADATLIPDF